MEIDKVINTELLDGPLIAIANFIWSHRNKIDGYDWNNPNWSVPANYEMPENKPLIEWKWEFIRRNPFFRTAWFLYQNQNTDLDIVHKLTRPDIRTLVLALFGLRNIPDPHHDAGHYNRLVWTIRREQPQPDQIFGDDDYLWSGIFFGSRSKDNVIIDIEALFSGSKFDDRDVFYVRIDTRDHIKDQLSAAFDRLMNFDRVEKLQAEADRRRKATRNHTAKWGDYLRVLDANEAGVSPIAIAELLKNKRSGSDSAAESLEQALKIRRDIGRQI